VKQVAFQGELGAFSHEAALAACGPEASCVPCQDFDALFGIVESGSVTCGVVPVENTLVGSVAENLDRLYASSLQAVAETSVRIEHCLITLAADHDPADIGSVASHPVALAQCRRFFAAHPHIRRVAAADTAGSVRDLAKGRLGADAAIASRLAATRYGCSILRPGIEDHSANYTRFLVVTRVVASSVDPAKTSLAFTLAGGAGSLHKALGVFAARDLDLSWIESRPIVGRPWEYRFYADVREAPAAALADALDELRALGARVKVLGRYPEAVRPAAMVEG
jgi:prephenate dehydratase